MLKFSFIFFLFVLNSTISPTPAPVSKPEIKAEAFITFCIYKFVIITEAAQFGIKPIKLEIIGPKYRLFCIKFSIVLSPIILINKLIIKVIIKIYIVMLTVCFKADFTIPVRWQ